MKKQIGIIIFYAAAIFLTGCIQPSMQPLFTERQMFVDPNLLGTWKAVDSNETWEFKKVEDANIYELRITQKDGKKGLFAAGAGKIDGNLFLNIFPGPADENSSDYYKELVVGMNSFVWVKQIEPSLKMSVMSAQRVESVLEKDGYAIANVASDDRTILTADTNDLQDFVINYGINADDANSIFEPLGEFERIQNEN
jgi:hypothetical protein